MISTGMIHLMGGARLVLGFALAMTAAGCCSSQTCSSCSWCSWCKHSPPPVPVNHILTYWDNRIQLTPNTVTQGTSLPGIAGRVYLFNEENKQAVDAQGSIVVEVYDVTKPAPGAEPQKAAVRVAYDIESLKQVKRKDMLGDGYTIFVPWLEYQPEIRQVKVQLSYLVPNAPPRYAEPTVVTLRANEPIPIHSRQVVPAAHTQNITSPK